MDRNSRSKQLAIFAAELAQQARVPANRNALENTHATLSWLDDIAAGRLIVVSPAPAVPEEPVAAAEG